MTDWTNGYVTDIEYTSHYYPELAPILMHLCGLSKNIVFPSPMKAYNWLEIGCGNGLSANALAACNTQSQFFAFDFNPAHILNAQKLAGDAELRNVHFFDDSFEQALQRDLPPMDYIVLHGIYSWVNAQNQQHIANLIAKILRPGGVVYISYNCLPGWAAKAPIRHLMSELADRQGGDNAQKVAYIKEYLTTLKDSSFQYFRHNPSSNVLVDKLLMQNANYLSHEYLNADWNLFYSNQIASDMRAVKLSFVASATIIENADNVNYEQASIDKFKQFQDTDMSELLKDFARNRQFRRDLFIKGKMSLNAQDVENAKDEMYFALFVPRARCEMNVPVPLGTMNLSEQLHVPILDALNDGPKSLGQLIKVVDASPSAVVSALVILSGVGYIHRASATMSSEDLNSARGFNRVVLESAVRGKTISVLVAPRLKVAFTISEINQYFLYFYMQSEIQLAAAVWNLMKTRGQSMTKEGVKLVTDEDSIRELSAVEVTFKSEMLPLLKTFGVLDSL